VPAVTAADLIFANAGTLREKVRPKSPHALPPHGDIQLARYFLRLPACCMSKPMPKLPHRCWKPSRSRTAGLKIGCATSRREP